MHTRFVILSTHSLFVEGVASRLRQYPQRVDVLFVDPQQPDYIAQIKKIQPDALLLHAADTEQFQCQLLCDLLMALPNVMIIHLGAQQKDIHIVTSTQRSINEVRDIIDLIEHSTGILGL
jgi:hypothetical protein